MMKLPSGCRYKQGHIICDIKGKKTKMEKCMFYLGHGSTCSDTKGNKHYMKDVILPINTHPSNKIDQNAYRLINIGNKKLIAEEKPLYHAGYLSDLGNDGDKIELVNPHRDLVFLRLEFKKDKVTGIDPSGIVHPLTFDKNTEIFYEPWFMDVGSYLFINPPETELSGNMLKLATEGDIMREWKR